MFCESLAEFLKLNTSIKILDISCNFIDDSNAATLKTSLEGNPNIIEIDVRDNQLSEEIEDEINEIITKNYLASKKIPYKRLTDYKEKTTSNAAPPKSAGKDEKSPDKGDGKEDAQADDGKNDDGEKAEGD